MERCAYCDAEAEVYEDGETPVCRECLTAQETGRNAASSAKRILTTLIQELMEATARRNEASEAFESIMSQFPSGLPHPDGAQRIKNASHELSVARKKMLEAHQRLNRFMGPGVVPEDLN